MNLMLILLISSLLIPLYDIYQEGDIWRKMLSFATISSKTAILILVVSVLRDDWMIGVVGVIILAVGNAALMLLAQVIRRMNDPETG